VPAYRPFPGDRAQQVSGWSALLVSSQTVDVESRRRIAAQPAQRKVTVFIYRETTRRPEVVLVWHAGGGLQVPAGSVEPEESFEQAALREGREETGLTDVEIVEALLTQTWDVAGPRALLTSAVQLHTRPAGEATGWSLGRTSVELVEIADDWALVRYQERDLEDPDGLVIAQLTGWVPAHVLTLRQHRQFFLARSADTRLESWQQQGEPAHAFTVAWHPVHPRPAVVPEQQPWLDRLDRMLSR